MNRTNQPLMTAPSSDDHLVSEENEFGDALAPLFDLASGPLSADRKIQCPFHTDDLPSLQFYADHFHCFGCGEHGDRIDWLTRGEGMTHEEAIELIHNWNGPPATRSRRRHRHLDHDAGAGLWAAARSIEGTPAARYLTHWRGVDVAALPSDLDAILRFHPQLPIQPGSALPLLAGVVPRHRHRRSGRHPSNCPGPRRQPDRAPHAGPMADAGAIKLWPRGERLIVAEGLETAAAAATRVPYRGEPLRPAWALAASGNLAQLPVLPDASSSSSWSTTTSTAKAKQPPRIARCAGAAPVAACIRLTPKAAGADFNDLVPRQELVA